MYHEVQRHGGTVASLNEWAEGIDPRTYRKMIPWHQDLINACGRYKTYLDIINPTHEAYFEYERQIDREMLGGTTETRMRRLQRLIQGLIRILGDSHPNVDSVVWSPPVPGLKCKERLKALVRQENAGTSGLPCTSHICSINELAGVAAMPEISEHGSVTDCDLRTCQATTVLSQY
ncbi:hypothetical protein M752DRAFT_262780 [Aspergillus phoenicis ATCC 13157]|uniref:Uncharacterized protein n=1 Tax=Aspergillus phoenicis ATCC 13157 TaxID=1353007 RepID=A0A370PWB9_ASPPH|nr:hypothetical protein M752DRAFT_262780 [Aspergillus phoenicis ATCC 13157]